MWEHLVDAAVQMGDPTIARFDTVEVRWKRSRDSSAADVDWLLADQPDLAVLYSVSRAGYPHFTVKVAALLVELGEP